MSKTRPPERSTSFLNQQAQDALVRALEPFEHEGLLSRVERVSTLENRVMVEAWMLQEKYTLENELRIYEVVSQLENDMGTPLRLDLTAAS